MAPTLTLDLVTVTVTRPYQGTKFLATSAGKAGLVDLGDEAEGVRAMLDIAAGRAKFGPVFSAEGVSVTVPSSAFSSIGR
jgi:hypothetical protein